ncbi:MAG: metallophosphoesterase family protein [Oligoflexia bacterium]|nr:metallophosphoesterase family protein [Oligoflexia bacterium]
MNIAVLSDIHGNFSALKAVLDDPDFQSCQRVIFCGDAVGYYFESELVLDFLIQANAVGVLGNHDRELLNCITGGGTVTQEYSLKYGSGLQTSIARLGDRHIKWLSTLPESRIENVEDLRILISHGSPIIKDGYLYPDCSEAQKSEIFDLGFDLVMMGHSHHQFLFEKLGQKILNPGSVGQSRSKGGVAHWAVIKIENFGIGAFLKESAYDSSPLINELQNHLDLPKFLTEVLRRIR